MRSRNMHRAGAWMKKRSRDKFALTHSSASLIHISGQLLTFSVLYTSFPYPTFLQNFMLTPCVSVSFCPLSVGQGQGMTPSPIRKEKMDPKWRHICCFGRQQYGLTPSFGCCDGKCKCVAGVHNLVWERRGGLHLAMVLVWLQMVLVSLSILHNCGQTDLTGFLPNSAWENHKTIK